MQVSVLHFFVLFKLQRFGFTFRTFTHRCVCVCVCVRVCFECVYLGRVPGFTADVATGALCERARWGQLAACIGLRVSSFEFRV